MRSFLSPAQAARIQSQFRSLEYTTKTVFWDVTWTSWRKLRPTGTWDDGTAGELWVEMGAGTGRLRENGAGGPVMGEDVIYAQSPYVLRTEVDAFDAFRAPDGSKSEHDVSNAWLVIEGRLFRVNAFAPRGGLRQHANAYLTEVFDMPLPGMTP